MGETLGEYLYGARYLLSIMLIIGLIIILYHQVLKYYYGKEYISKDFLNHKICNTSGGFGFDFCSRWAISHFIFYFILGFSFPKYWDLLIAVGILYEIFEAVYGMFSNEKRDPRIYNGKITYSSGWWAANYTDIIANLFGLFLGVLLAKTLFPDCMKCTSTACYLY